MAKRKFRTFCNRGHCNNVELIIEIEDSINIDQEAANALCRKLEQHFKDKHPETERERGTISVCQGDKWATLQANGTIKESEPAGFALVRFF